jgi:ATP-dependent helicase/nuclease subunit A
MPNTLNDTKERQAAIDPSRSFIVQAPAGSGKTELLTQRFLKLLCHVNQAPEEIIAITFTRKAAAEMRHRIISALNIAGDNITPLSPHEQDTTKLAKKVLEKDQSCGWQLQKNPNRLRILTIDALASYLVRQMPISANTSTQLNITDNALPYYEEAVSNVLQSLANNPPWQASLKSLLLHLDNRADLLERLLIDMLSKREQWLPHIMAPQNNRQLLKKQLNTALENIAKDAISTTRSQLNNDILCELIPLANFAGRYCSVHLPNKPVVHCKNLTTLDESPEALPLWRGIADLLLTQKGEWRKRITKLEGFPVKGETKEESAILRITKIQMQDFLASLTEHSALMTSLHALALCPPICYNDNQWAIVNNLVELLPIIAAELNLLFDRENITDFIGLNLSALQALGEPDNPTDLALHLDYRINHLLIDEFQDTSIMQYTLIERLIAGWQANEGRSIFIVGDPMQSIYRFRHAEVALFIRSQQQGIGNMPLMPLKLMRNFRSCPSIIDWTNQTFSSLFPKEADVSTGSTPYSAALATKHDTDAQIQWHLSINDDGNDEAKKTAQLVTAIQKKHPQQSIAILVKSRSQLTQITAELHHQNIRFHGVDLEPLTNRPEIRDLHTLTRVLLHRSDKVAWLAMLRAPYCGLTLSDLQAVAHQANKISLYRVLKNHDNKTTVIESLSSDGQCRLQHSFPAIYHAIENDGRQPLSQRLKQLWQQLHGPQTLSHPNQHHNITEYLKLIDHLESQSNAISLDIIDQHLKKLYAESRAETDTTLQIMTIHKAKGLEFDHVILPGLHKKTRYDPPRLLKWLERPNQNGQNDLILAPIKATDCDKDAIYQYLVNVDNQKTDQESIRLLYVAITRAKQSIYFMANVRKDAEEIKPASSSSFLALLWDKALLSLKNTMPEDSASETSTDQYIATPQLRRFKQSYLSKLPPQEIKLVNTAQPRIPRLTIGQSAKHIGIVIHQLLERIAQQQWNIIINHDSVTRQLKQLGMPNTEISSSAELILKTIESVRQDPRGQWILSPEHQDAHNEYALSVVQQDEVKQLIIDRCFIDKSGTRWIIDYKTSSNLDQAAYQSQLDRYANAFQQIEDRPIQLGVYFPITADWLEWTFANQRAMA